MSDPLSLQSLEPFRPCDMNPHRYADPAETQRLVDACCQDDARSDADCAEFERRTARRRKRKGESGAVALVSFLLIAVLLLPTLAMKWPVETAFIAFGIGAVVGIVRGAKRANPEW